MNVNPSTIYTTIDYIVSYESLLVQFDTQITVFDCRMNFCRKIIILHTSRELNELQIKKYLRKFQSYSIIITYYSYRY